MIIDGKKIAKEILGSLKNEVNLRGLKLRLAVVLVGKNPGLKKFVELKGKAAKEIGIDFKLYDFPEEISSEKLKEEVKKIIDDPENNGVLIELPLPGHINAQAVLNEIPVEKDVDVLSEKAQTRFYKVAPCMLPPAVEAVKIVMEKYGINPKDKKVSIFGQGILVGKPIAHWFERQGAKVFRIDEFTKNPEQYSRKADIVVSGVGKPDLIKGDMIKKGAIVFDFGYENKEGKIVGDVEFESVEPKASLITPVPGGIGPIVIAAVLKNLILLNS